MAVTEAYLAVARMCSYLGDHRTDRTSALCPKRRKSCLCIQVCLTAGRGCVNILEKRPLTLKYVNL